MTGLLEPGAPLVLDAVGPDGAKFHADFPEDAVTFPVNVTMQPLQSVGGLSGAVEAVSFEPSGVLLVKPALLTIDGPVANALAARGFGYQNLDTGPVARPVITASGDGPLRLVIGHFSGYGAAADDPPQWDIGTITATEAHDIISLEDFAIANAYRGLRNHNLSQTEAEQIISNALDGIAAASKRLGDAALVAAATGDVSVAAQTEIAAAVEVILASSRADQLLGRPVHEEALQVVEKILKAYLVGVIAHCTAAHDVTVLNLLLLLNRQAQLLGNADTVGEQGLSKCTSAKVHFLTTITGSFVPDPLSPATYGGTVRIDVSAPIDFFDGLPSADVAFSAPSTLTFQDNTCTATESINDGIFSIRRASLKQAPPPKPAPISSPAARFTPMAPLQFSDASVLLSIGMLQVHDVTSGSCGPSDSTPYYLNDWFDQLHPGEAQGNGVYLFDGGFEVPADGSAVLARRTIDRKIKLNSVGPNVYASSTLIEIIHTPG